MAETKAEAAVKIAQVADGVIDGAQMKVAKVTDG